MQNMILLLFAVPPTPSQGFFFVANSKKHPLRIDTKIRLVVVQIHKDFLFLFCAVQLARKYMTESTFSFSCNMLASSFS